LGDADKDSIDVVLEIPQRRHPEEIPKAEDWRCEGGGEAIDDIEGRKCRGDVYIKRHDH